MGSIVRDFSQEAINGIKEIIKEVENEDQCSLFDWLEDTFVMKDLDISNYINNVKSYQKQMIDKHNISSKDLDKIIKRVHAVDLNYAKRFMNIYDGMVSYNEKIKQIMVMISPRAVTINTDMYSGAVKGIKKRYDRSIDIVSYHIDEDAHNLCDLRDVPWYEKVLNTVGGTVTSFIGDNIESIASLPTTIIDSIFGTSLTENDHMAIDSAEEWIRSKIATDDESFYHGKMIGDCISTAEGAALLVKGGITLASAFTTGTAGAGLTATGGGAVLGVPAIVVSAGLVIEGAAEMGVGAGICDAAKSNFNSDKTKCQNAESPNVDDINIEDDKKELDKKALEIEKKEKDLSSDSEGVSKAESIPKRPSWRQSELDVQSDFQEYSPQKSFINGNEVPYGTKGSSRPDFYKKGTSIEVKNYKITTPEGRSRLVNNISKQVNKRIIDLPSETAQTIIIDVRGQNVSNDVLRSIRDKILKKSDVNVNIKFKR